MDKLQILFKLENCIALISNTDNVYVRKQLEAIADDLKEQWDKDDIYVQEIKNVLNYDETMSNLDKIRIR
jgi:hypothetical protein